MSVLNDLTTLEIRGSTGSDLIIEFDEPLNNVKYANFEAVILLGVEQAKRRPNYQSYNPSDHFDYVPESEKVEYNVSKLIIEEKSAEDEVEIVPYEVYLMEKKRAKSITFYGWTSLLILRIHDCQLDELYWEIFDGLETLEHLSLEHNKIKIVPPFAFFGAINIKSLSLARNFILDLHYRALAGLLELEQLDLSYNNITKLSELSFPPFPKLQKLDLRNNPIKYIFPATFGVMNNTKSMYFGSSEVALDLNTEDNFQYLNLLEELVIMNGTAEAVTSGTLRGLERLEKLTIRGELTRIEFDAFSGKPYLKELSLRDCQIEEISMDTLFGITNLEIVDLSFNKLSSIPQGLFDEQHQLREIYLQNNQLMDLPHNFFDLPALKLVRLNNNPWLCNCEMVNWKQGVTNALKVEKVKTVDCGFEKGACVATTQKIVEYVYSKPLSPRCEGSPEPIKGRSLYYALRRDLRCNMKKHRVKSERKHKEKKERLAQKSAEYYAQQASELRWHNAPPTQSKLEPYDYQKIKRTKEMDRQFQIKMYNTIMRDQNVEHSRPTGYRKYRLNDPDDNTILNGNYFY